MSILIKNGIIIDGTGKKMYPGDLFIKEDRIKDVGLLKGTRADTEIDATGHYVVPGFVDILNHSDSYWTLFNVPNLESLLRQGVTSILCGNCGSSLAPLAGGELIVSIQKWADISEVNVDWLSMKELLSSLAQRKMALNFATLVGHATLRRGLLEEDLRGLTAEELNKIKFMLTRALEEGAFGLSVGLAYSHAKPTPTEELIELSKIVKKYGGLFSIHLRNESDKFLGSVNEVLSIARITGVSAEISHFKVLGEKFWPNIENALNMIEVASRGGLGINFDMYPYLMTGSVLYTFLPDWVAEGGRKMLISRLKEPPLRKKAVEEMKESGVRYEKIIVAMSPADKTFVGKSIGEIAENQGVSPEEAFTNLLIVSGGHVIGFIDSMSEKNIELELLSPFSFIASDGSGYNLNYIAKKELVHPRCFGAFPRLFSKFVKEKGLLEWEDAVHKITSGPAEKIGLKQRGKLSKDYFADVTVLNPEAIQDTATFDNPFAYPQGIEHVIVNGKLAVKDGKVTGEMSGRVLRRG